MGEKKNKPKKKQEGGEGGGGGGGYNFLEPKEIRRSANIGWAKSTLAYDLPLVSSSWNWKPPFVPHHFGPWSTSCAGSNGAGHFGKPLYTDRGWTSQKEKAKIPERHLSRSKINVSESTQVI